MTVTNEINDFIDLARKISQLHQMASPQFKDCAKGFYCICRMILKANENISRWFNRFAYFDFGRADVKTEFNQLIIDYKTLKGNNLRELKFRCGDIGGVYRQNIESKIGALFVSKHRTLGKFFRFGKPNELQEARQLFESLTEADRGMINYIADEYISRLDNFVKDVENAIDESDPLKAERRRLDFKKETSDMRTHLEKLNNELGDLVIKFANFAGTPITLISEEDCMKSPKTGYSEP